LAIESGGEVSARHDSCRRSRCGPRLLCPAGN
jgi:hypothetical protein